jgi:hypothetical protein
MCVCVPLVYLQTCVILCLPLLPLPSPPGSQFLCGSTPGSVAPAQVGSTSADYQPDERDPEVELVLTESDYTLKMWPHKFKAVSQHSAPSAR